MPNDLWLGKSKGPGGGREPASKRKDVNQLIGRSSRDWSGGAVRKAGGWRQSLMKLERFREPIQ